MHNIFVSSKSRPLSHERPARLLLVLGVVSATYCHAVGNASQTVEPHGEKIDEQTLFARYTGLNTSLVASIVVSSDRFLESCSSSGSVMIAVQHINAFLAKSGVPKKSLLTSDELVLAGLTIIITLVSYYILMGKSHVKKRKMLANDLKAAHEKVTYLEEKLMLAHAEDLSVNAGSKRKIRIFMDGAFDLMHYGHMNAFRLARSLGTELIVGVNSDKTITQCKGAPLMKDEERLMMVRGCKFVDKVVEGCPYVMNEEYLNHVISKYNIDYVIHGDDPCIVDGKDVYETAKKAGKYQSIPRTEGVSTTDIVGRILLMTKDHHYLGDKKGEILRIKDGAGNSLLCDQSKFLTTSRMLRLFSAGMKSPKPGMRIIYIDGAWDMFHCGHVSILKEAKKKGDYLIVGIHNDTVVNRERGCNLPLMNLHERVLSVMGCRHVDDVLIDAPRIVTPEMISSLQIDKVVHGSDGDGDDDACNENERYKAAKDAGIFNEIAVPMNCNLSSILDRIQENQQAFQAKIAKKKQAEKDFYEQKYNKVPDELRVA